MSPKITVLKKDLQKNVFFLIMIPLNKKRLQITFEKDDSKKGVHENQSNIYRSKKSAANGVQKIKCFLDII